MIRRLNPILAALLAAGALTLAVPSAQAHRGDGHHGEARAGVRMLRGLDLTQEQRDQVRKLYQEQAPAVRERAQAARQAQQELRALALSPNFDSGRARELADAAAKAQADAAVLRAEGMSRVYALLTPEQRTKLEQARERRGRR